MIDARTLASRLDTKRDIRAQYIAPGNPPSAFVELRKMQNANRPDTSKNAAGASQLQVGTPDFRPSASDRYAARYCSGLLEAQSPRLGAKHGFQARSRHKENLEIIV